MVFAAGVLALMGYLVWQQRGTILISFVLLMALLALASWLLRPFAWLFPPWLGWLVLFRYLKKR